MHSLDAKQKSDSTNLKNMEILFEHIKKATENGEYKTSVPYVLFDKANNYPKILTSLGYKFKYGISNLIISWE